MRDYYKEIIKKISDKSALKDALEKVQNGGSFLNANTSIQTEILALFE